MKKSRERSLNDKKEKTASMIFRIEPQLKEAYIKYCEENGYSYGKKLRLLIKKELKNG
jgi:hypothetical protein